MQSNPLQSGRSNPILSPSNLRQIASLVQDETGIVVNEEKESLVQSRLTRRLRTTKFADFDSYINFVRSADGRDEFMEMLRALTTNVTKFDREPHHFNDLRENVLPNLVDRVKAGGKLRMWSSACSTGEEAYTIAMELCDFFPEIERYDVKILATDLDSNVVESARSAVYLGRTIGELSAKRQKYFPPGAADRPTEKFAISKVARRLVKFNVLNLLHQWPFRGPFDVIFCRNVMIYFNRETQETLLKRFSDVSSKETRLYIGHSERLVGPAQSRFRSVGTTTYAYN